MDGRMKEGYGGRGIVGGEVDPITPSPTFQKTSVLALGLDADSNVIGSYKAWLALEFESYLDRLFWESYHGTDA